MAKPRVFVSSTFYDLKQVRAALEVFIREYGFDPILNERGTIAYSAQSSPERGAYRELENCDIVVSIIGGRYGSTSDDGFYSISQKELKQAHEMGKQIYIFVERAVYANYEVYKLNKSLVDIQYPAGTVDVFRFIEEVESFPVNNAIAPFEIASDITCYLREQWAGLFQRLLHDALKQGEQKAVEDFKSAAQTLNQLISFLTEERRNTDATIRDILLSNHPCYEDLRGKLRIGHRVFFVNREELSALLAAYGFVEEYSPFHDENGTLDTAWRKESENATTTLEIQSTVFDEDGKLKPMASDDWSHDFIYMSHYVKAVVS